MNLELFLEGSRAYHPKIGLFSILIILNWNYLRNSRFKKDTDPPLSPESGKNLPHGEASLCQEERRHPRHQSWQIQGQEGVRTEHVPAVLRY